MHQNFKYFQKIINFIKKPFYRLTEKPFDLESEEGRSNERQRLATLALFANIISKGMGMALMIVSISLTVPYLGRELFGIWITISSFANMLTFLDLGIGNALTNRIASINISNNKEELKKTISGGLAITCILGFIISTIFGLAIPNLPWGKIIKITNQDNIVEIKKSVTIFSILFGVSIFTNSIQKIFAGLQKLYIVYISSTATTAIAILLLWIASEYKTNISTLLIISMGCPLISSIILIHKLNQYKLISFENIRKNIYTEKDKLLKSGSLFFILQIGTMIGWGADNLIISTTLGAASVASYNIVQRLFQFISQPLAMINSPLWGAYADAHARGDINYVSSTLKKSIKYTLALSIIGGTIIVIIADKIIQHWSSGKINASQTLVMIFFSWTICDAVGNAFAMYLNGCNIIKPQIINTITLITIAIPIKLLSIHYFGIAGMLLGFMITYLTIQTTMYGVIFKKIILQPLRN